MLAERAHDGAIVLFSSHQLDLVEHLCDALAVTLDDGAAPDAVLDAARAAGSVEHFAFERRRLSDVFRGRCAGRGSMGASRAWLPSVPMRAAHRSRKRRRDLRLEQEPAEGASDTKARLARAIAQLARNPSPQAASTSTALPVNGLKAAPTSLSTRLTGMAVVVLTYLLIFIYGQRITSGVVEEKSSRVVEVLLASVRPAQLLTGKVIGMGGSSRCWPTSPTAPIASTTLYAIGSIGLGQVAVSAVICLLATVATARLAAGVYERSILRTGARVRLGEALRADSAA